MNERLWVLCIQHGGGEQRCQYGHHDLCSLRAEWAEDDRKRRYDLPYMDDRDEDDPRKIKARACLNYGPDCDGEVEFRMPLSGTGRSFPRCEKHWADRLEVQRGIDERYPDSPFPPADFDPTYAGEVWDEED